jgi:hypothetical protein
VGEDGEVGEGESEDESEGEGVNEDEGDARRAEGITARISAGRREMMNWARLAMKMSRMAR